MPIRNQVWLHRQKTLEGSNKNKVFYLVDTDEMLIVHYKLKYVDNKIKDYWNLEFEDRWIENFNGTLSNYELIDENINLGY